MDGLTLNVKALGLAVMTYWVKAFFPSPDDPSTRTGCSTCVIIVSCVLCSLLYYPELINRVAQRFQGIEWHDSWTKLIIGKHFRHKCTWFSLNSPKTKLWYCFDSPTKLSSLLSSSLRSNKKVRELSVLWSFHFQCFFERNSYKTWPSFFCLLYDAWWWWGVCVSMCVCVQKEGK